MTLVRAEDLWIEFPVYDVSAKTGQNRLFGSRLRGAGGDIYAEDKHVVVTALREISFEFREGDRVALMGRNGSGKSTLLRALSGVYTPTRGSVTMEGSVSPMFSMGLGMDMDATGLENIGICGLLWGMSRAEIKERTESIIDFSELGDYLHMPVRTYSSGMMARLAFSIATAREPSILLLDEGIGAGDRLFYAKAFGRIQEMCKESTLLFIALHGVEILRLLCNKAIWLHGGAIRGIGDFEDVVKEREEWEQMVRARDQEKKRAEITSIKSG